jgi:hypothetical protein
LVHQIDKCHYSAPNFIALSEHYNDIGRRPIFWTPARDRALSEEPDLVLLRPYWGESLRTQMLRKLMGGEGSPWAWSLMGACW